MKKYLKKLTFNIYLYKLVYCGANFYEIILNFRPKKKEIEIIAREEWGHGYDEISENFTGGNYKVYKIKIFEKIR